MQAAIGQLMNQSSVMAANPPYIRFEKKAVERRKTVEEGGEVFYIDVNFAHITSHGSKDTVTKIADEWFSHLKEEVRQQRFPAAWLEAYLATYRAWQNDQEPPVIGTSLRNWPAISPAESKKCTDLGVRAVEDLANANEELIGRLGMGGRSLCDKAKDWVRANNGDTKGLIQERDAMRHKVLGLEEQIRNLQTTVTMLQTMQRQVPQQAVGQPAQYHAPLEQRLQDARDDAPEADEGDLIGDAVNSTLGTTQEE